MALGPRMLGTFWEHIPFKWASDGALMGPWTHMETKMKAQVHKVTNLGAIWSQFGPFWVHLGLQLGGPREVLGEPLGGVLGSSWPQEPNKTPKGETADLQGPPWDPQVASWDQMTPKLATLATCAFI